MPYASASDVVNRLGADHYALLTESRGGLPVDVDAALADASSLIDSYLAARYPLPLAATPAVLVSICVDIAAYRLATDAVRLDEETKARHKAAIDWLRDVGAGRAALPGQPRPAPTVGGVTIIEGPARVLGRDQTEGA